MFQALTGLPDAYAFLLVIIVAIAVVATVRFLRRTTPISKVHKRPHLHLGDSGKQCKFDPAEVRRTQFLKGPHIPTDNLSPADARVVKALGRVSIDEVRQLMLELTGVVDTVVRGKTVRIKSRNTFTTDIVLAFEKVHDWFLALGYEVELQPYKYRGKTLYNIQAIKRGKKTPDKWLIVGAHGDSTAGRTHTAEPVAPGANDDCSGTVSLMIMAKLIAELDLEASVMFCIYSGEEQGLWGSSVHADKVAAAKLDVIGQKQYDMVGWTPKGSKRLDIHDDVDRNGSHALVVVSVQNQKRYGINLDIVDTHNRAVTGRSDHASYQAHGMKGVLHSQEFTDTGFDPMYHSTGDTVMHKLPDGTEEERCNLPYMCEVIKLGIADISVHCGLV